MSVERVSEVAMVTEGREGGGGVGRRGREGREVSIIELNAVQYSSNSVVCTHRVLSMVIRSSCCGVSSCEDL